MSSLCFPVFVSSNSLPITRRPLLLSRSFNSSVSPAAASGSAEPGEAVATTAATLEHVAALSVDLKTENDIGNVDANIGDTVWPGDSNFEETPFTSGSGPGEALTELGPWESVEHAGDFDAVPEKRAEIEAILESSNHLQQAGSAEEKKPDIGLDEGAADTQNASEDKLFDDAEVLDTTEAPTTGEIGSRPKKKKKKKGK